MEIAVTQDAGIRRSDHSLSGADFYLHERYLKPQRSRAVLASYYWLKPVIPRPVQLRLRRAFVHAQARRRFPAWPIEPILIELRDQALKRELRARGAERLPLVNFWPDRHRFACVLTHDVEGPAGIENIDRVCELERSYGFVSSWNFCAEWYPIPPRTFERLREAGCEIGLHGIRHDGKLFSSRVQFEANLPKIHHYLDEWAAVGFRSPATHRRAEWMNELGCLYDSSFPDTDPFEPQAGGCCSIFPFMLGDCVELPITLVQDHTLIEILRRRDIELWVTKSQWIIEQHGLINVLTHPDYLIDPSTLGMYEALLEFLANQEGCWRALPCEVAEWWRLREGLSCAESDGTARIVGDANGRATVAWASDVAGEIHVEP